MTTSDATQKFSDRVEYYLRYRPRYPEELYDFLQQEFGLTTAMALADVGSGTGFLAEGFLKRGLTVYGVEPDAAMRAGAEQVLAAYPTFHSIAGRAEATSLLPDSINLITVGQAFHWFEPEATRKEFQRILQPGGSVALVWNERSEEATPFMAEYEQFLRSFEEDLRRVSEEVLNRFFAPDGYQYHTFSNVQTFDFEALKGRFLSSSYAPLPGSSAYDKAVSDLHILFARHAQSEKVPFVYTTQLYYGRLSG